MKGARPIPAADRLGFDADGVNIGDVGVADRALSAVQAHPALHVLCVKAVNVTTINYEVVGHGIQRLLLRATFTKSDEIVNFYTRAAGGKLDALKTIMMRAGRCPDHRLNIRCL